MNVPQTRERIVPTQFKLSFETAWSRWLNGPSGFQNLDVQEEHLRNCIKAATTLDELAMVFTAASQTQGIEGVTPSVLKKMIECVETEEDAKRVLTLASRRRHGRVVFRALEPLARKKLESFQTA